MGTLVQRRLFYAAIFAIITAVALLGLVLANRQAAASASQVTTVALEPVGGAKTGAALTVRIVATHAQNLAGFQASVRYDQTRLRLVDAAAETDLKGSGRDLLALEPVERAGIVTLGAATCPVKHCQDTRPKRAQQINRGVDGRVVLGTIQLYTDQPGQYSLALDNVKLVDPQGNALAFTTADTVLDVTTQ